MSPNKRMGSLLASTLFILISVSGYFAINDLAGSQSQQHQQSISPIFGIIESELAEPLYIAKTLDKIGVYADYFADEEPDPSALVEQLRSYSERFGLEFYVAHDKSRKQYNSDGRVFDLIEGEIVWYFALKDETDQAIQAVLGKREDVHLYIDVRQYDENGKFIGFVGVGKSLNDFIKAFEVFKQEYGHDFIFVNNRNEIVLSSHHDLLPKNSASMSDDIDVKNLSNLPWFNEFVDKTQDQVEPSLVVKDSGGDLLVSQFSIESLQWSLYILTPLNQRQEQVLKRYGMYLLIGLVLMFALYKLSFNAINFYANKLSRKINSDPLTKLANRQYANFFFSRTRRNVKPIAVLVIDLDYFKQINDQFGHNGGDIVLTSIAQVLNDAVRPEHLVVRWGGEEFAIILPNVDEQGAKEIAQNCRATIEANYVNIDSSLVHVTASIGVSYSNNAQHNLNKLIDWADQAMYAVKRKGKNAVMTYSEMTRS